jgi:hypothetical protein
MLKLKQYATYAEVCKNKNAREKRNKYKDVGMKTSKPARGCVEKENKIGIIKEGQRVG